MRFQFRLQNVLNVRRSQEHGEQLRLGKLNQDLRKLDRLMDTLTQERIVAREELARELMKGLSGGEVRFRVSLEDFNAVHWDHLAREKKELEQKAEAQRQVLAKARQQREVLETLSARRREAYLQESNRKEQQEADELFLRRSKAGANG